MFPTGSKLFLGLTGAAVAGFVVFGFFQEWNTVGVVGLGSAIVVLAFLAGVVIYTRDADVAAGDATAAASAPAAQPAPSNSLWPLVGALGGGLVVVGLVTDKRFLVGGFAVLFVALVEWMVQGWSERASGDAKYNRAVRGFILHPLEMPILGAIGLGAIIFSFSRIMLKSDHVVGPSLFIGLAALITFFGFVFAAKRRPSKAVAAGICTIGALGILAGGIWSAAAGERPELAEEGHIFRDTPEEKSERSKCGEEVTEADEKASGSLASKSSISAEVILRDGVLEVREFGRPADRLHVARGNTVNVIFKNEGGEEEPRRLAAQYLANGVDENGKPTTDLQQVTVCTNAIEDGKVQLLTLVVPKPSVAAPEGKEFKIFVPGVETAELPLEVPA